jgi:transposase
LLFFYRFLPPYIIHKAQQLYDQWIPKNVFPGTRFNCTPSGWSEENVFFDWLCYHFIPSTKKVKKPILLLMDGHNSHLSTRIIKHCMDHGIHLECLPPHTTTILQPLDVLTFSKLKNSWRKLLSKHFQQTNSQAITKQKFALLVILFLLLYSHSTLLF